MARRALRVVDGLPALRLRQLGFDVANEDYVTGVSPGSEIIYSVREALGVKHKFNEQVAIEEKVEAYESVEDFSNTRVLNTLALTSNVSGKLAVKLTRAGRTVKTRAVEVDAGTGSLTLSGLKAGTYRVPVSALLAGHDIGLEEIDQGLFNVYFGPIWLGHFIERTGLIVDSPHPGTKRQGGTYKGRRTVKKVR